MNLIEAPDRATLADLLATAVASRLSDALDARGDALLAVPGGTTPGAFLTASDRGKGCVTGH